MRRRGYVNRTPGGYPLDPLPGAYSLPATSAILPASEIARANQETTQNQIAPIPFDMVTFVGNSSTAVAGVAEFLDIFRDPNQQDPPGTLLIQGQRFGLIVPDGVQAQIDGIFPYLETSSGPFVGPRIPNNNFDLDYTFRVKINGAPDKTYGAIRSIITPWNGNEDRPLIIAKPTEVITADVRKMDTLGQFRFVGLRLKGRFVPLTAGQEHNR